VKEESPLPRYSSSYEPANPGEPSATLMRGRAYWRMEPSAVKLGAMRGGGGELPTGSGGADG